MRITHTPSTGAAMAGSVVYTTVDSVGLLASHGTVVRTSADNAHTPEQNAHVRDALDTASNAEARAPQSLHVGGNANVAVATPCGNGDEEQPVPTRWAITWQSWMSFPGRMRIWLVLAIVLDATISLLMGRACVHGDGVDASGVACADAYGGGGAGVEAVVWCNPTHYSGQYVENRVWIFAKRICFQLNSIAKGSFGKSLCPADTHASHCHRYTHHFVNHADTDTDTPRSHRCIHLHSTHRERN